MTPNRNLILMKSEDSTIELFNPDPLPPLAKTTSVEENPTLRMEQSVQWDLFRTLNFYYPGDRDTICPCRLCERASEATELSLVQTVFPLP